MPIYCPVLASNEPKATQDIGHLHKLSIKSQLDHSHPLLLVQYYIYHSHPMPPVSAPPTPFVILLQTPCVSYFMEARPYPKAVPAQSTLHAHRLLRLDSALTTALISNDGPMPNAMTQQHTEWRGRGSFVYLWLRWNVASREAAPALVTSLVVSITYKVN